jgi:hypothetical protein
MTYLIPSGKTAIDKYDNRTVNAEKVLPRLDMRLLASNLQYLAEITQGYSLSGDEGYSQAQNLLSTITASNYTDYSNALSKMISTLVAHRNFLDVDPSSTANGIILIKSKITTEDAPSAVGNFTREEELPFKFKSNLSFTFKAKDTNTGSVTVNIVGLNGLSGSIPLKNQDGDNLSPNDIIQNYIYEITSDTVNNCFILTPHLRKATNLVQGISYLNNPITIANNSTDADNDIDFTAGNFQFADGSGQAVLSAITKRLDASWTAGTNQGGLDTGTKANSTWYHCYAIHNPTSGVSDAIFSTNATNPTLPTGYTKYKYQGSVLTNVSGNIIGFWQENHSFYFKVDNGIVNTTTPVSTLTNLTLSAPPNSKAITTSYINIGPSVGTGLYFKDIVNNTSYPVNVSENDTTSQNIFEIRVNNSSQIQYYLTVTSLQDFTISTIGYINLNI